ncbi:MAG: helix-turn-helix domain-containing protein [Paludibacter sp.]|nr:helix-turn-helix domain-containing protein [Paludibacter sp.]
MVFDLGLSSETQLCDVLEISQGAISQWKKRGSIPGKYKKIIDSIVENRQKAAEIITSVKVSTSEVGNAMGMKGENSIYKFRSRNPYLYKLIEDGLRLEKVSGISYAKKMKKK